MDGGSKLLGGVVSGVGKAVTGLLDPSKQRLQSANLANITASRASSFATSWMNADGASSSTGVLEDDWRVRLSIAPKSLVLYGVLGNEFMVPIYNTSGVIFPITPNITITHTAKYSTQPLTHSNYTMQFYEGSDVGQIMINAEFPIQNIEEGQYLLAAIYFFRSATKMYWGDEEFAGSPPPMLFLSGYGDGYFPNVPCVVTQFAHTMPEAVDYIDIPHPGSAESAGGKTTRLPVISTLQVTVQPILSRVKAHGFNLKQFANGELISKGYL